MATRDSTRRRLLDAADELLFTDGVAATPVDAILERAGVSPATLYRAYGSKEELVAAALVRRHEEWLGVWDAAVEAAPDDRGRLLAVFDAVELFRQRPDGARWCAFLGTAAEHADPPDVLADAIALDTHALRARLRRYAGPVAGDDAPELAEQLLLLVSGALAVRLRDAAEPAQDGRARRMAEVLLDATG